MVHNQQQFKHETTVAIRFKDIDAVGHVNNGCYASYLEEARVKYAKEVIGWDGRMETLNIVVATLELQFKKPIYLNDKLSVFTRVSELGGRSFTMEYLLANTESQEIYALAKTRLVHFLYDSGSTERVPESWRESIKAFEGEL